MLDPTGQYLVAAGFETGNLTSYRIDQDKGRVIGAVLAGLHRGIVAGTAPPLPDDVCEATPLAGTEALHAPHPGVVAFLAAPGDHVVAGQVLAHVVDPLSNRTTPVHASIDGVLYARHSLRWATANLELCRVAGKTPIRAGNLLSP